MMKSIQLNGMWQAKCLTEDHKNDFTFSGTVPGCVHTDLMGSKLPADPFCRDQADACTWVENCDFEYEKISGGWIFTVHGYGHGVGMSQYGAHYMALDGYDYLEILEHYYTGILVE